MDKGHSGQRRYHAHDPEVLEAVGCLYCPSLSSINFMLPRYVAKLATIPNRRDTAINLKYSLPLVEQRIADMTRKLNDKSFNYETPVSSLQPFWLIKISERSSYRMSFSLG